MSPQKTAKKSKAQAAVPQLRWEKSGRNYLVTNDSGSHVSLSGADFQSLVGGCVKNGSELYKKLSAEGFVRDQLDFDTLASRWKKCNSHLEYGPGLHILVLTLRCNFKCLYCQAGAGGAAARDTDMTPATAKRCVDFALKSPNPGITIEFQGGEPLMNWPALQAAVVYGRQQAAKLGKDLKLALVSNFSMMTEEKAEFLLANEVSICGSLDGPAKLHNANRPYTGGDSHAVTAKWLKYFQTRHDLQTGKIRIFKPSALLTVTRQSLANPEAIADEYIKRGLEDIFVRPLSPLGFAKEVWDKIGYDASEFGKFYLKILEYILKRNAKGVKVREKMAVVMLEKIVNFTEPGYLDSRCPCGASIGQLAYNYNGDIYTCDEGRMAAWSGNDMFRVGNVVKDSYKKVIYADATKACAAASNLETQPVCSRCAYRPYCGVCPVYNYEVQGSLAGDMPTNQRCALQKAIFGAIFENLEKNSTGKLMRAWVAK